MKNYYLRESDYGSMYPVIIDEDEMEEVRCGNSKHHADSFVELCKAATKDEAIEYYYEDVEEASGENIRPMIWDSTRDFEEV